MQKNIVILLVLLYPVLMQGQDINLSFEQIDSKTGLGAAYNEFIYKDSRGFTWIGSIGGLYRYDGLEMKVYQPDQDSTGMLGANVQSPFFEDSAGNIWFSTTKAMNCYVRSQDTIFSRRFNDSSGLPVNQHYGIFHLENDSIIWTKAGEGIYTYNIKTEKESQIVNGIKVMRFAVDADTSGVVQHIYACPWDYGSGFYKLSRIDDFRPDTLLENGIPKISRSSVEVSGALLQNSDSIWLFTHQGLVLYKPKMPLDSQFVYYKMPAPYQRSSLRGGALIRERFLAVGVKNAGLWIFDIKTGEFSQPNRNSSPQLNDILDLRCIYVDREDHLWISPWDGAQVQHSWLYNNFFLNPFEQFQERAPVVNSIVEDENEQIWSATANNGIYVFDKSGKFLNRISYTREFKSIKQLSLSPNGEIWAINDKHVFRCKSRKRSFSKVHYFRNLSLFRLVHLTSSQKLLTTSRGVYEVDVREDIKQLKCEPSKTLGEAPFPSFQIFRGDKGYIYLPDNAGDLRIYRWNSREFEVLDTIELGTEIYDIAEDLYDKNILWIGSLKGLLRVDLETEAILLPLKDRAVLTNAKILGIEHDNNRQLWLATNLGLLSFNPFDHEVLQFRQEDGIVSHDFSLFSHLKTRQGKFWLGTNNGIVALNPDQIQPNLFVPQPYLRSLAINQENIGNKFGHQIGELDYINLKPSERSLEFNIAALSSYFPSLNKIYYKLENHEDQWKDLENGKPLQFINLESGRYSLQLKTVNANGVSNDVQKAIISFEILPFLYEQIWFWIVVAVVLGLIIWTVVRIYYRRKMREQHQKAEHQRELERRDFERKEAFQLALQTERNRIAAEMHDDLGGELTAINLIIKKTRKENINSTVRQYLTKIEKYATQSVESMGEIIWAMNSNYDNLSDLVAYIRRYVAETLDENGIEYKAIIARDLPNVIIAGKKRRNIFLTIKEALHNTVKHSKAKLVTLDIHIDPIDQDLIIIFHDNGIGIDDEINPFGNGLNNIQERMKDIDAKISIENYEGTKISLKIPVSEINQPSLLEAKL